MSEITVSPAPPDTHTLLAKAGGVLRAFCHRSTTGGVSGNDFCGRSSRGLEQSAKLRDNTADRPDWDRIGQLLLRSYRELLAALATENV